MFKKNDRVKLTDKGKMSCTQAPLQNFRKDHVFTGTIVEVKRKSPYGNYVVKMDDKGFSCSSHGVDHNTFHKKDLERI